MGIQELGSQVMYRRWAKGGKNRTFVVFALCAILGLVGSLVLTVAATVNDRKPKSSTISSTATPWATPTAGTSQSKLTPVAPTAIPTPAVSPPISPFPTLLWQEVAALQSHNRFLYTGNHYLPEVALTFDDGPNPYYTPQVLTILQQYGIKATFFCVGRLVAQYPNLVKQEYAAGNLVGNHSWSHPNLALLTSETISTQINRTSDAIQQAIGVRPTFFRPPYGVANALVLTQVNLLGLTTVIWNDEARDWTTPGIDVISSRILSLAGDGAIILLHDGGGIRSQTVAALPTIITTLQQRGFQFVTLQQMVNDLPKNPASSQAPIFVPTPIPTPQPTPIPTPRPTPTPIPSPTPSAIIPGRSSPFS